MVRALVMLGLLASCAPGSPPARVEDLKGPRLTRGMPRPDIALVRADGSPFDFRKETQGHLTFLFFGYTNCPDVCPLHMANLAAAMRGLSPDIRRDMQVIFVTTDPARDTPEKLGAWLAHFDSTFVGLRGDSASLATLQRSMGMPIPVRDGLLPDSSDYAIAHGAHLWAFTPDDSAHVIYPMGIQRDDLASDIPTLLKLYRKH